MTPLEKAAETIGGHLPMLDRTDRLVLANARRALAAYWADVLGDAK